MAYLLDSSALIQAKNEYYGFDLCPGFWRWIDKEHAGREVFSIVRVRQELEAGNDELADWARQLGDAFFFAEDAAAVNAMQQVSRHVQNGNFTEAAKREFLASADPFLIAFAMSHGHTVVTHEVHIEGERKRVKIPTVCLALNVPCQRTFAALRQRNAAFVLRD